MPSRRVFIGVIVTIALPACAAAPRSRDTATQPRYATVKLAITGMTWQGCAEPVRSALAAVNGVVRAEVFFEGHEAVIEYDASRCTVADLIAAVGAVRDANMPVTFRAAVKK